jgi:hypothetical protein
VPRSMPAERMEIRFTVVGETARQAELTAHGNRYEEILAKMPSGAESPAEEG